VEGLESGHSERVWSVRERVAARTHAVWLAWLSAARECVRKTAACGVVACLSCAGRPSDCGRCYSLERRGVLTPSGEGGTIDRAMHKDLMEQLKDGPCSETDRKIHCPVGGNLEDCLDKCG
jgi:hypothetical protein